MIELSEVSRAYDVGPSRVVALDAVDLSVDEGEFVVVLGPSGSGKTTLLNVIGGLDRPTSGTVEVGGRELSRASRGELFTFRRQTVSFIFQSFNLFPGLTARENVQFAIDNARPEDAAPASEVLELVGLGDRVAHFPHELSGGEQQRVAIARALATGGPVVLADEPTGELDFQTGGQILELLYAQSREGRTVLVVTHNREIARVADRVVELSGGHIVRDGPPEGGTAPISELRW